MMRELIENSAFLGVVITIGSFELGRAIRKKWNFALFNPLLLAILFSIGVLLLFRIDYGSYLNGAKYINFLLTPATVCLAVPLYEKFELLKKNALAITLGIAAGVAASLATVLIVSIRTEGQPHSLDIITDILRFYRFRDQNTKTRIAAQTACTVYIKAAIRTRRESEITISGMRQVARRAGKCHL